jgi:hypothetical protein
MRCKLLPAAVANPTDWCPAPSLCCGYEAQRAPVSIFYAGLSIFEDELRRCRRRLRRFAMIHHPSGADRFRDLAADDAYRSWLISRNQPPIVYHSGEMQWRRLRVLARRVVGLIASQHLAIVASRSRLRVQRAFGGYDRQPKTRTVDRSRS